MSAVREVLVNARELISKPEAWTKRSYARSAGGDPVVPYSPKAACWCVSGAISISGRDITVRWAARDAILFAAGTSVMDVPTWNDAPERTHAEVLAVFDKAIEAES